MMTLPLFMTGLALGMSAPAMLTRLPESLSRIEKFALVEAKDDYAVVKGAKLFSIGGIGVAGTKSPAEVAFRKILTGPDAATRCGSLIKEGTAEGRLYGLLGLKLLDAKAYAVAAPAFLKDDSKVRSASGCSLLETTVAAVAKNIDGDKLK